MKKLIAIFVVVATCMCAIVILTKPEPSKNSSDTAAEILPPQTETVTIPELTPQTLETALAEEEDVFVYMYSPTCVYCQKAAPIIMPIVYEHDVPLKQFNVAQYGAVAVNTYQVDSTPTLIHFQNGQEVERLSGLQDKVAYLNFLTNN